MSHAPEFLFKIKDTFYIKDMGLLLSSNSKVELKSLDFMSKLKLIRPDKSELETSVIGINWQNGDLVVSKLQKKDVPIGTEIWLIRNEP